MGRDPGDLPRSDASWPSRSGVAEGRSRRRLAAVSDGWESVDLDTGPRSRARTLLASIVSVSVLSNVVDS